MAVDERIFAEARKQAFRRFWKRGSEEFGLTPSPSTRSKNPYASNLVGIGRGPGEKANKDGQPAPDPDPKRQDCLRFYVSSKPAHGLLDSNSESFIPPELNGVPTDVVEVGRTRHFSSCVSPGAMVSLAGNSAVAPSDFGALGALVREAKTGGALALITCNHVIAWNGRVPTGSQIHIASRAELISDDTLEVATLAKCVPLEHDKDNLADCAYATFGKDYAWPQSFGRLDPVLGQVANAAIGDKVVRIDGGVTGYVSDVTATIEADYEFGTYRLVNQIVIRTDPGQPPFASEGDSGSIGLRDDGNQRVPIAMVWGGRHNLTFACPLQPCLEKLGLTWVAPLQYAPRTSSAVG
jgi:hypothetical protein